MKTLEEIHLDNRQRLAKHIGQAVYQRAPNPKEVLKINLLIDLGKGIPEVLSSLRESSKKQEASTHRVNSELSNIECRIEDSENRHDYFRTPLEKYFHEYVGP